MSCTTVLILASLIGVNTGRPDATRTQPGNTKDTKKDFVVDITGYYTCRGESANGKQYSGVALIIKKNDIYVVQWTMGLGSTFVGVGIRQGDTMAISWVLAEEKGFVRGVNLYKISPGPRLAGHWASLPGDGFLQSETLSFLKKLDE